MQRHENPLIKKSSPSNEWVGEDVFKLPMVEQAVTPAAPSQSAETSRPNNSPRQAEVAKVALSPEAEVDGASLEQMSQHLLDMIVELAGSDDQEASEPAPLAAARCLVEAVPMIEVDDSAKGEAIKGVLYSCLEHDDPIKFHLINDISALLDGQGITLADHEGMEDLTAACLVQAVRDHRDRFVDPIESISSPAYGYFINQTLANEESAGEVKERLSREDMNMIDVARAAILDDSYVCLHKPGEDNPELESRTLGNVKGLIDNLRRQGYDPLEDGEFVWRCCDEKLGEATQEHLYQAGVIDDDNVTKLYDFVIGCGRGVAALVSTKICPDTPAAKFWNTVDIDDISGRRPAGERTALQSAEMDRFGDFLDSIRSRGKDRSLSDYFTDGAPNELFWQTVEQSTKLRDDRYNSSFVSDCIDYVPSAPLIRDKLGDMQRRSVEAYDSLASRREKMALWEVMQNRKYADAQCSDPAKVAEDIQDLVRRFPFLRDSYSKLLSLEYDGKMAILGDDYIGDIVYYDSHADDIVCNEATSKREVEKMKRHLDTLRRYDLFNGDRARMTNHVILLERAKEAGELFDDLAEVPELDEETKLNLTKLLSSGNTCHISSVEELKNYRAVVSERLCESLISGKRSVVVEAAHFLMRPDRPQFGLEAFNVKQLDRAGALTINDRAVMLLRKKIERATSAEGILRAIRQSTLCVPVVGDDGVARVTKVEGSESDLTDKLMRFVTDDWNQALFDPHADNEGVERVQVADDQGKGEIDVLKLDGTPFNILSHTIYRFGNPAIYDALMKDPGIWNTARGSSTISASCISSDYLYYLRDESNRGVTLGFNNICYGGIIGMCAQDAYLSGNFLPNMFSLPLTTCDEFIKQCIRNIERSTSGELDTMNYNEIGLFRNSGDLNVQHGRLQPSYVVVHGTDTEAINDNSKKFARYFGVPIVLINDRAYYNKNNYAYHNKDKLKEVTHGKKK